jgi:hypothetical protein
VRAPWQAGFFQVLDAGKKTVFDGASQFLDPGESDFAAASSFGGIGDILGEMDNQQTEPDRFTELWILLAGMAMVGAWMASTRGVGRSAVSGTETSGGGRRGEGIRKGGRDVV